MTKAQREELLRVMPQDNINDYMERYGFTWQEVVAEMERRAKADEEFLATEVAKMKVDAEEKAEAGVIVGDALVTMKDHTAKLDAQYAKGLLTNLDYLDGLYWILADALNAAK